MCPTVYSAGCAAVELRVQTCDASIDRHGLFTACGLRGGDPRRGGTYVLTPIPENYDMLLMRAPRSGHRVN